MRSSVARVSGKESPAFRHGENVKPSAPFATNHSAFMAGTSSVGLAKGGNGNATTAGIKAMATCLGNTRLPCMKAK